MVSSNIGEAWQRRLIPLMVGMLVCSAIFFAAISIREFERVHAALTPPAAAYSAVLGDFGRLGPDTFEQRLAILDKKTALVVAQDGIARRYQQAHAIILARLWTRFMAFIIGTLMALVGSAFVLGKLREETSTLAGEGGGYSVSLASSSPGILLAGMGTILMLAGLFSYFEVNTTDAPPYRPPETSIPDDTLDGAPPPPAPIASPDGAEQVPVH